MAQAAQFTSWSTPVFAVLGFCASAIIHRYEQAEYMFGFGLLMASAALAIIYLSARPSEPHMQKFYLICYYLSLAGFIGVVAAELSRSNP